MDRCFQHEWGFINRPERHMTGHIVNCPKDAPIVSEMEYSLLSQIENVMSKILL